MHSGARGLGAHRIFITRSQTITGHRRHVRGARHWNIVARPISTRRTPGHLGRYGEQDNVCQKRFFGRTYVKELIQRNM